MESSTIVIKVKYGETLRRINGSVNGDGQLDLGMNGLREKVLGLFNFAPEAEFTLTYIDEDGDVVTLVDEGDLCDAMRQSLNPLRIAVKLNEKGARFYARSSGSSTPMRSPRVQHPVLNLDRSVSEVLKSVPEPFREALSKLSLDFASKASSSVPGLAELVDCLSKMGQSFVNQPSEIQVGTASSTQIDTSIGAPMNKEPEALKDDRAASEVMPNASEKPTYKNNQKLVLKGIRAVEASIFPASDSVNLNAGVPGDSIPSECVSENRAPAATHNVVCDGKDEVKKLGERLNCLKAGDVGWNMFNGVQSNFPASDNKEVGKLKKPWKPVSAGASASLTDSLRHSILDFKNNDFFGNSSPIFPSLNRFNECPFTGMPVASDSVPSMHHGSPPVPPFKRSYNLNEGLGGIFHKGVRCDGCGVYPITGSRFKSKVKEDYDLCSICFSEMGNESDYIRMDRPVSYRHPFYRKGLTDPMQNPCVRPPTVPHALRGGGMKPSRKLDSRFILDVNVQDGTIMGPSTPFTKIWRIRNNGTMVWPQGTQLVWIGGDKLSSALSVELQISSYGVAVDNELDVPVDFTAPELPGRYISYWRMASPYGQKFGQRVWVLIEVDASLSDSFHGLNLNLPPHSSGITGPEIADVKVEPMVVEHSLREPDNSNKAADLVEPIVDPHPVDQELNFPINDSLLVGGGISKPVTSEAPTSVSYPVIDLSEVAPVVASDVPSSSTGLPASAQGASENNDVEQNLLRELEQMGFKQVDLNKEILRMNEYDLEQSVDDLCGVAEWDPILEELQEMGFHDNETNRRLLKKNNGSIKRVVMDLIAGEKV